jgi:AcrR family transcriptional regulator
MVATPRVWRRLQFKAVRVDKPLTCRRRTAWALSLDSCPLSCGYFPTDVSESMLAFDMSAVGPATQPEGRARVATIGRPRGFDVEEALDAALVVFWRQGYDGTTVADLTSAMGINRPALYAAFQGKKELFVRAIDRYYAVDAARTFQVLEEPTAWAVTEQYLLRSIDQLTNPGRPLGCFVLQSALVCSEENADVAALMARQRKLEEDMLSQRYKRAQDEGDLSTDEDPAALARFVFTFRHGLAVMACGGTPRDELRDSAQRMLAALDRETFCRNSLGEASLDVPAPQRD